MVGNTGRTADTRRIRRLKQARPVDVEADAAGAPSRVRFGALWEDVTPSRRPWRIDQHWWREPVQRDYFRVAPEDGPPLTLYRDLVAGEWFRQEY
jgi:hypothetical protein